MGEKPGEADVAQAQSEPGAATPKSAISIPPLDAGAHDPALETQAGERTEGAPLKGVDVKLG